MSVLCSDPSGKKQGSFLLTDNTRVMSRQLLAELNLPLKFKEARASARCWLGEIKTEELAGTGRQKWERSYTGVSCCSINNGTKYEAPLDLKRALC